jgi:hypothetical protein
MSQHIPMGGYDNWKCTDPDEDMWEDDEYQLPDDYWADSSGDDFDLAEEP